MWLMLMNLMFVIQGFVMLNFGYMMWQANLSLIPKFTFVKSSKRHVCVESKQTRKPHHAAEVRDMAPLELIHSNCAR